MKLFELFENINEPKTIVVFGGRFQPMHKGHVESYKLLVNKFGKDSVFIATSNKTNFESALGSISPLTFQEKLNFMVDIYKIDKSKIIETKNPLFLPKEIVNINGTDCTYISVTGIKNVNRYENNELYTQYDINGNNNLTLKDKQSYYMAISPQAKGISATEIRNSLLNQKTETEIKNTFTKIFGVYDENQCDILMTALKKVRS